MLEQFFTSKVRVKILKLYFLSKEHRFHVRGVTRLINEEINAVRRELRRLYKIRLLGREKKGNKLYYYLHSEFLFYPELYKMMIKAFGLGGELREKNSELGDLKHIFISYDFFVHDKNGQSNVDLLLVGKVNMAVLEDIVSRYQKSMEKEINYSILSQIEFEEMLKNRNPFIRKFFEQDVITLVGEDRYYR